VFFSRAAGGGGALVGIAWLVPIFGVYFGVRLARAGQVPARPLAGAGLLVLALALMPLAGIVAVKVLGVNPQGRRMLLLFCVAAVVAVTIAMQAWPALGRALFAYALAARIPVAIVMLLAMFGNWGTHYDVVPGFSGLAPFVK
jgi:NO-binding membrane sensor protein with MHYT domain